MTKPKFLLTFTTYFSMVNGYYTVTHAYNAITAKCYLFTERHGFDGTKLEGRMVQKSFLHEDRGQIKTHFKSDTTPDTIFENNGAISKINWNAKN